MSFRNNKPVRPPPPKGRGAISLGGISFKQLEEDEEEEEDLCVYTGKYDKILDESQKSNKQLRENRLSTSSNSSTSSMSEDVKQMDRCKIDSEIKQRRDSDASLKQTSGTMETSDSPLRKSAKARLESSKELFSGLKGKITDKISKTIEEFSNDSSPSPEGEKGKEYSVQVASEKEVPVESERGNSLNPIVKESAFILQATPVQEAGHSLAPRNYFDDDDGEEESLVTATEKSNDGDDDSATFFDPKDKDDSSDDIVVLDEHFNSEPFEDFANMPAFTTSTRLKPKSKIKQMIPNKSPKISAIASLSALNDSAPLDKELTTLTSDYKDTEKMETSDEGMDRPKVLSLSDSSENSEIKQDEDISQTPQSKPVSILRQLSTDFTGIPLNRAFALIVALFAYLIVPLPSYISGLVLGVILASIGWIAYIWLMKPLQPDEPVVLPPLDESPPPVPVMNQTVPTHELTYKGWMNELTDYNVDDYHINKTHSIYVSLEGTHLRIQRPKNPAPKRAMWDETLTKPQFIHQRHYDVVGSKVFLSPSGLVKKRIWSKKYPICISIKKGYASSSDEKEHTVPVLKHTSSEPLLEDKQREKISDMGFELLTEEKCNSHILFLFARTGREKEEWFKRLSAAASGKPLGNHIVEMRQAVKEAVSAYGTKRFQRDSSSDSIGSSSSQVDGQADCVQSEGSELLSFSQYMGRLMPSASTPSSRASSPTHSAPPNREGAVGPVLKTQGSVDNKDDAGRVLVRNTPIICDSQLFWLNAIIGRCFFDFLRDKWWIGKVTEKLQKKLSKIHVPYFIEELQVSSIEMGYEIPAIRHAGKPYMDERGFWVDLDITYTGGFKMTIETKMNLMRLKKSHHTTHSVDHSVDRIKSPITDSEEEDSAESSTDEEEETGTDENTASGGGTSKKFMRYLNKITQSRYFQQATEYKVVRRAMENVSNTPLTLTVTVNSLIGKLAVNIPPPPSDRLWYGFRGNPRLRLSAKPQVGERAVTFTHITDWIEKKLAVEFQRVFVMPNMDDLVIPILVPGEVNGTAMPHSMSL